jgi:hypothetical protein
VQVVTAEQRDKLLATCEREAVHLEMRDTYALSTEAERFAKFLATGIRERDEEEPDRRYWTDLVQGLRQTGRRIRRARVVSEPVTDYIRYEWAGTDVIVEAGEEVRWLPRRLTSTIALPGNDFWLFDGTTVVFTVFTGNGEVAERQLSTERATVDLCVSAFEVVWAAGIPHSQYTPH